MIGGAVLAAACCLYTAKLATDVTQALTRMDSRIAKIDAGHKTLSRKIDRVRQRVDAGFADVAGTQKVLLQKHDALKQNFAQLIETAFAKLREPTPAKQDKQPPAWLTPQMRQVIEAIRDNPRQRHCLDYLTYAEARGEGEIGVKEVVLVTLNRIRSGDFGGNTACPVAYAHGQYEGVKVTLAAWHPHEADAYLKDAHWIEEVFDGDYDPPPGFGDPDVYWYMRPEKSSRGGRCNQLRSTYPVGWINHHRFGRSIRNEAERQQVMSMLPEECKLGHGHVRLMARSHHHRFRHHHKHAPVVAQNEQSGWWSRVFGSASKPDAKKHERTAQK